MLVACVLSVGVAVDSEVIFEGSVPSNADGERSVLPVASFYYGHLAPEEASRSIEDLVCVAVVWCSVRVRVPRAIM